MQERGAYSGVQVTKAIATQVDKQVSRADALPVFPWWQQGYHHLRSLSGFLRGWRSVAGTHCAPVRHLLFGFAIGATNSSQILQPEQIGRFEVGLLMPGI